MGTAIGWLAAKQLFGRTIGEPLARLIFTAGLFLAVLGACAGLIAAYNHHVIGRYQQKVDQRAGKANDQASTERGNDAARNSKSEQEMHNVIQAEPDRPIAPTSRALGCERLRRAGRHPPACR